MLVRYLASDDPEFESKAADIIELYLTAAFCVDEKTAIQAWRTLCCPYHRAVEPF